MYNNTLGRSLSKPYYYPVQENGYTQAQTTNELIQFVVCVLQCESKKSPLRFSDIFPKQMGIFNQFLHTY